MIFIAWVLPGGRHPSRRATLGIALGIAGIGTLVSGDALFSASVHAANVAALLGLALVWALASVLSNRWLSTGSPLLVAAMELLLGGALLLV